MTRPAMLKRFPSMRVPRESWPVIPEAKRSDYPSLADDFVVLDREAAQAFRRADLAAIRHQNRFRRQQVVILIGSALLSGFGGLQAVYPEQRWPGVLLTILGIGLGALSQATGEQNTLSEFLTERVKAERLRALHFTFLARTGPFAKADRESVLRRAVLAIQAGREPS
jgi:hypothetical protein